MSIRTDLRSSDTLVIAATGFSNKLNLEVDDFFKAINMENVSKIIITDKSRCCTLAGLPPRLSTFFELVGYLKSVITEGNYKKVITTGTSGGGHTALLLGYLLRADKAIVFSPYPYMSKEAFIQRNDPALKSMGRVVARVENLSEEVKPYLNLDEFMKQSNKVTKYYIHVSRFHEMDYKRTLSMRGVPSVNIISHPYHTHALASSLHKDNLLNRCFTFPSYHFHPVKQITKNWRYAKRNNLKRYFLFGESKADEVNSLV